MDGDVSEILEDFLSGPLVTWMQDLERLLVPKSDAPSSPQEEKRRYESPQDCFLKLLGGDILLRVMEKIDLKPGRVYPLWTEHSDEAHRVQKLQTVLQRLKGFYQNDLQQLILMAPPNIHLLAREPLTAQSVEEMRKLLLLLLGGAVQCERRDEIIGHIQTLDIGIQASLASAIREVTREPQNVLKLQWKELGPYEVEQLLRDIVSRVRELVDERDEGLQKLWELQREQNVVPAPPPDKKHQHLGVQLAEARAQVRRLQHELEEKVEELLDQQDEFKDLEGQLHKIRQENRALVGEARLAGLYRDELDALREKALRTERLQAQLGALQERLPVLEQCRVQLKEEREFSQALLETKAMLEEQLEAARARGQRLNQLEKEKRLLQSSLNQAQEEREQLCRQTEELLRENLGLERRLRQNLGEPLDVLRAEELEFEWAPSEPSDAPVLLSCEVNETGRLLALERENQDLRRRLQEALENAADLRCSRQEEEEGALHREPALLHNQVEPKVEEQMERQEAWSEVQKAEWEEATVSVPEREDSQALKGETGAAVAGLEAALSEARALRQEAEQEREAESCRVSTLEERLKGLQDALSDALAKLEQERERRLSESERLLEEVQALEREREALRAGAEALRAAATQAGLKLAEAQEHLQGERRQVARLSQKAQQTEEDLQGVRLELEALQRSLEQHKVTLAQMEAEKGALEEALSQAENQRRQLDRDNRRLKAQAQAQEEALAAQGLRLAHLEAQSRRQAVELGSLADASQHLRELEQESASLRGQLVAQRETLAVLEEELQKEKTRVKEKEATLARLKEQLSKKEENLQEAIQSQRNHSCIQSEELQVGLPSGKKSELEEENSALRRQIEELNALNRQLTGDLHQAKSCLVLPQPLEEQLPVTKSPEGQRSPDLHLLPQANARNEALSARLIEVECRNAALQAEKLALSEHLGQLKSQVGNLQAALLDQQGQLSQAKEESGKWQAQNSTLQVEAASLRSQQTLLDAQVLQQGQRLAALEAESRGAQKEREEWRGRYAALLRDHDCLMVLHERQGADLEGLLAKHTNLKGALRSLEQEHHELQGRHSQLLGQKAGLEEREAELQKQKEQLGEAERGHRALMEQHGQLKEEHERVKQALSQAERARDDLQGELHGSRNRLTGLQLEQARLEAESVALREQNQQLDAALGRLGTQCELLAQLKGNQEEENRHLLDEIQALSRENRRLLERSMESREHFQEEQRQYLDKLGELRREKQKLVEKIMDQYRVLDPALPRGKKSNWIAEKIRKLMKPRREATREQLRPMAEGAGSSESLAGQEGHVTDRTASSTPGSPASLRKASSVFSIPEAQQVNFRRHRLSSRMPAVDGAGEESATPRQRFRQRRLGMLGGSREEAVVAGAAAEWDGSSQVSQSSQEERGPPLGEEEQTPACQL